MPPYLDGTTMTVRVCCKADAGELDVPVRYGVAVTLEVAEGTDIPISESRIFRLWMPSRFPCNTASGWLTSAYPKTAEYSGNPAAIHRKPRNRKRRERRGSNLVGKIRSTVYSTDS